MLPENNPVLISLQSFAQKEMELPAAVYTLLPPCLLTLTDAFENRQQKDIILLSSLAAISGILPNYEARYMGKPIGPNLYAYFYGQFGSDKGLISLAELLLLPIHREKRERSSKKFAEYQQKIQMPRKKRNQFAVDDPEAMPELEEAPVLPPDELLILPANNTKANMIKQLAENNGYGVIIETEADTLTSALKAEHGSFFDTLRKAYHHERITAGRKSTGMLEIEQPRLSVIISSTARQIARLIPDIEDGLFSRFFYWRIYPTREFYNAADQKHTLAYETFKQMGDQLLKLYHDLERRSKRPVILNFSKEMAQDHYDFFCRLKASIHDLYEGELNGIVNRFGLMFYRFCMVLTMLRNVDRLGRSGIPGVLSCSEADFRITKSILLQLVDNTVSAYELLTVFRSNISLAEQSLKLDHDEKVQRCAELKEEGLSYREIAQEVLGNAALCGTVSKLLRELQEPNDPINAPHEAEKRSHLSEM